MMIYDKKYASVKPERKRYKLSSFSGYGEGKSDGTLPCDHTERTYNYRSENGRLLSPYGISEFEFAGGKIPRLPKLSGKRNVYFAKCKIDQKEKDTLFVSHTDGAEVYVDGADGWEHIDVADSFTRAVNYYKGSDEMLFLASEGGLYWFFGGRNLKKIFDKKVKDLCAHFERLFAVVEGGLNSVWFSKSGNPLVWTVALDKGGYIEFDGTAGKANAVRSFNNYVYVFCDYGIYRITAFGDQTQFSLKKVYACGGRIFGDSAAVCGEYIVFAAEDGLYLFDGYQVTSYPIKTDKLIASGMSGAVGCFSRGKYILSFRNTSEQEYGYVGEDREGNALLVADFSQKSLCIMRGISLVSIYSVNKSEYNEVIGFCDDANKVIKIDGSGRYLGQPMLKYWQSAEIDFGRPSDDKSIAYAEYRSKGAYTLGVIADGKRREFKFSPRENKRRLDVKGKKFIFYIRSDNADEEIFPPYLTVDFLK